jgi:hypothetical protein
MNKTNSRIGYIIFLLNLLLVLFLMTNKENIDINFYISCASCLIALVFNIYFLIKIKKKVSNIVSLILIILTVCINTFIYLKYLV